METSRPLRIGITCYPSIGGSGILASSLGAELARRGHDVHFISYERPFRLPPDVPRVHFHPVGINAYGLFKYPDYTLPLSVKMAEVSREYRLDLLHVHYAVPHATAAVLARSMLPPGLRPKIVTTLHGTDTTLLGRDPGYGPAIRYALACSDAVTVVSEYLRDETRRVLDIDRPIDVVHNFFEPRPPRQTRDEVRHELGVTDEMVVLHSSNLRPVKRIDLLLEAAARVRPRQSFRLVILAGEDFAPFAADVRRLGLEGRVVVLERVPDIEDYLQVADLGFVRLGFRELLPEHPRGDVLRLPQRRDARGGYSRGRGGRRVGSPRRPGRCPRARPCCRGHDRRPGTPQRAGRRPRDAARANISRPMSSSPATRRSTTGPAPPAQPITDKSPHPVPRAMPWAGMSMPFRGEIQ